MTRIFQAELGRLLRRRTIVFASLGAAVFAVAAALAVLTSAEDVRASLRRGGATLADLNGHGGGTEAFAVASSFVGFLVFVIFIAMIAGEFSGGTFRALLLREPHRLRVILGKLAAILAVAAGVVLLAEVLTFGLSLAVAPGQDISTADWFSLTSAGDAV